MHVARVAAAADCGVKDGFIASSQPAPGILRCQRASQAFQKAIYQQHLDGVNRSRLGRREGIGAATVERYFRSGLQRQFRSGIRRAAP